MPRIDLDGNVAGVVTAKDERYAQRMIAGLATRAAAKAIEDRGRRRISRRRLSGGSPRPCTCRAPFGMFLGSE